MSTVRLADLAAITRRSVDMLKNMTKANNLPWDDSEFPAGTHRRFDGYHALALVLLEMLTARGETISGASEALRDQANVVESHLDSMMQGLPSNLFVAVLHEVVEDTLSGARFEGTSLASYGTASEVSDLVAGAIARTGHVRDRGNVNGEPRTVRSLGGIYLSVASVGEAYRLLKVRAEAAGFLIDGRSIMPKGADGTEGGS